jgi:hypothetical protein
LSGPCIGQFMINDAYCVKAKMDDCRYIEAILTWRPARESDDSPDPTPDDPAEAARLRREKKPKIPLGVKQKHG